MSSKVTAPDPAEQGLTLAAPRWHGSLHEKWREQPEQFAWLVILISFTIFAVLAFAIPIGVNYTIRYLPISQTARFAPAGESVWLLYVPKASETIAVTTPRDNIRAGDSIVATGDATQGTLNLVSDEEAADNHVLGSLHIYSGTKVEVLRLSRPFFKNWSNEPYQARLRLDAGQARIFTNSGNARPLSVQLETPHGTVQLASGSYQISVEEQQTDITVVSGQATLWREADKAQRVTVHTGQRGQMTTTAAPQQVAAATQNLLLNGDFTPPVLDSWNTTKDAEPEVALGDVFFSERDGRKVAYFIRQNEENQHNEVSIQQVIDKKVDVYNSLILQFDVNILFHNLPGAGYANTEFPLRVEIDYTDQYGKDLKWGYGFYYRDPEPPGPTLVVGGEQVPQAQWYTYRSPNLIAQLDQAGTRPSRINRIRIYASGWNYQSMVSEVYLDAE